MSVVTDQAQTLRHLVREVEQQHQKASAAVPTHRPPAPRPRSASIIAVTSGKGGVGKTNVAVNLAIRLSTLGRRVVLMDADLGTANADVLCNLTAPATLAHVVAGRRTLEQVMIDAPGGFRLIPGASGLARIAAMGDAERNRLMEQVHALEQDADLIVIDTGAGVNPNVLSFAMAADQLLVVTTPEPTAITDAYALTKIIARQPKRPPIGILVNMVRDAAEARNVFSRIDATARRYLQLEPRYAGHVPADTRVPQAVRLRRPFVLESPNCDASRCIAQLAHRIDRHASEPNQHGLLQRMMSWLVR